jgi:hypothetical protein
LNQRKWAIVGAVAVFVVCLVLAILSYALTPRLKTIAQETMESYLRGYFHGDVNSFFLKAVDPFFKGKNAGMVVPIKITGAKDHPSFGLDFHDSANKK